QPQPECRRLLRGRCERLIGQPLLSVGAQQHLASVGIEVRAANLVRLDGRAEVVCVRLLGERLSALRASGVAVVDDISAGLACACVGDAGHRQSSVSAAGVSTRWALMRVAIVSLSRPASRNSLAAAVSAAITGWR